MEEWPRCEALIAFHSTGFPLQKAQEYVALRRPLVFNDLQKQELLFDRRETYRILQENGVNVPNYVLFTPGDDNDIDDQEEYLEINGEPSPHPHTNPHPEPHPNPKPNPNPNPNPHPNPDPNPNPARHTDPNPNATQASGSRSPWSRSPCRVRTTTSPSTTLTLTLTLTLILTLT